MYIVQMHDSKQLTPVFITCRASYIGLWSVQDAKVTESAYAGANMVTQVHVSYLRIVSTIYL